jgi:hypothetical protein
MLCLQQPSWPSRRASSETARPASYRGALVGAEGLANVLLHGPHGLRDLAANLRVQQQVNGAPGVANAGCA